jgi:EAL domain-containing protein (putative c-di-GMP-specific phosphodiesterase class I)
MRQRCRHRITWDALAALGCDIAQGYYLSRPLPGPQLTSWLRSQSMSRVEVAS